MANPVNDMVADSVLALILQIESSPASVKSMVFCWFARIMMFFSLSLYIIRFFLLVTARPHHHDVSHHHVEKKRGLPKEEKKTAVLSVAIKKERDSVKEEDHDDLKQKSNYPSDKGFLVFLENLLQKQFGNDNITKNEKGNGFSLSVDGLIAHIDESTLV